MRRLLLLLLVPVASAHVPAFDADGNDRATAFVVEDPTKSWVFFGEMGAGERWFRLELAPGDQLFLGLSTPTDQASRPTLWITQDTLANATQVAVADDVGVEPFTPVALRNVAELRTTADTQQTLYVVVVADAPAHYGLAIGARESFTPIEWIRVPVDRIAIQSWAGVPAIAAVAGEAIAVVAVLVGWRTRDLATMVRRVGAGIIVGSAGTTGILLAFAMAGGGFSGAAIIPLVFMAAAVGIGLAAWRPPQRRWMPAVYGAIALLAWAGLWIGPALLVASALWPDRKE